MIKQVGAKAEWNNVALRSMDEVSEIFRSFSGTGFNFFKIFVINHRDVCLCNRFPVNTGRKLNVHKTFRRHPGHPLNVLCTFSLSPVSTGF